MNYQQTIEKIYKQVGSLNDLGTLATYIPELANVEEGAFGICLSRINSEQLGVGNYETPFSIQSIAKVLSLTMAYALQGEQLWERVGVEPSGTAFNSLVQLEADEGMPRNPFINAGAIVICDQLVSQLSNPKEEFLEFVRDLSGKTDLNYSTRIAESEATAGFRNVALCNFIKSFGKIENDPSAVLDFYFNMCSLEMNCADLSKTFLYLANSGKNPINEKSVLTASQTKRINALMQTCGFYDESGEFAFKVGLPGKSGVGGGIIAIHPMQYTIAVWSPKLNSKGNSWKGVRFLEAFTTATESSIF